MSKSEKRQATGVVGVRVTPAQKTYLKEVAQLAGVSVSEYLLSAALQKPLPRHAALKQELGQLIYHLGKIGGNVNQIACSLNLGRPVNDDVLHVTLNELRETQQQVRQALGSGEKQR